MGSADIDIDTLTTLLDLGITLIKAIALLADILA